MKGKKIGYYVTTALFSLMMLGSASMYLTKNPEMVKAFAHLGYPLYFMTLLGTAKLLGALTLLIPMAPRGLKEWAYAGFTFNLIAAIASHASSGDAMADTLTPLMPMALLAASYVLGRGLARGA
jgi:hypothetical protein